RFTGADGVLTLLGLGNGNDENLTIDLDNAAANNVTVASSSGVTNINFTSIGSTWGGNVDIGANSLLGTTAVIDFTDFDVDSDGKVILAPDSAGDAITINNGAGDIQAVVVDAISTPFTSTAGLIDL